MAKTSVLEAVKIQARAIVPVVKALEAELGKARAHEIVGNAIAESWGEFLAGRTAERNTAVLNIPGYPMPALETSSFAEDVVYWHLVADTVELLGKKSK